MKELEDRYLERLSELYPSIASASTEIINLTSILNLPKGTEHFLSDIHGEYEAFNHVMRNGSGAIRRKIDAVFNNTLSHREKKTLATLIYYPSEKMELIRREEPNMEDWYKVTLYRLIEVCKRTASKYTRSKVRKMLPKDFAYVIEELITEKAEISDKEAYYNAIVQTIIETGRAEEFIAALSELIQRLVVDHLHILGDIYDRGPGPHLIMDKLMDYNSVDIQWGNHDILWMGAAAGQSACIATVIRNCARYGNMDILEDGYGINVLPLATYALETYKDDPCTCFALHGDGGNPREKELNMKIHKAITIIQFKLEGQTILRRPEFAMDDRLLLDKIDYDAGTITLDGQTYPLLDTNFPTIDPKDPYRLSPEEEAIMKRLEEAFLGCEKLQKHIHFLLNKGDLYKVFNGNLLFHGCIPLNEDGTFKEVNVYGQKYAGRDLYEALESYVRKGFSSIDPEEKEKGKDIMLYIWFSPNSPLFGKDKMTTFERYFIADKKIQKETKNPYYNLLENKKVVQNIMKEFGVDPQEGYIINGHVPVKSKEGESPIKGNGRVIVIDGGFSRAYQSTTGIAGYTLSYDSHGMNLAAHDPFESTEAAIEQEKDIHSSTTIIETTTKRTMVGDTDAGKELKEQVEELEELLEAYRSGRIAERA